MFPDFLVAEASLATKTVATAVNTNQVRDKVRTIFASSSLEIDRHATAVDSFVDTAARNVPASSAVAAVLRAQLSSVACARVTVAQRCVRRGWGRCCPSARTDPTDAEKNIISAESFTWSANVVQEG